MARHTLSIIGKFKKPGTLFEIGVGSGTFLAEAGSAGFQARGLELNPLDAQFIIRDLGLRCECQPAKKAYQGEQFDVIDLREVLSHLPDPLGELVWRPGNRLHNSLNQVKS